VSTAAGVDAEQAGTDEELQAAVRAAVAAQHDVGELVHRAADVHGEMLLKEREREFLGTYVAAGDQELAELRGRLNQQQQRDFDLRQKLSTAQHTLDELTREQVALLSQTPEVEAVTSLPTPLAETVSGKEIHLRLADGNVSIIPLDDLLKEF
jgi:chromosome segregation ATPase